MFPQHNRNTIDTQSLLCHYYFTTGSCIWGTNCKYSHIWDDTRQIASKPCKDPRTGRTVAGANARRAEHALLALQQQQQQRQFPVTGPLQSSRLAHIRDVSTWRTNSTVQPLPRPVQTQLSPPLFPTSSWRCYTPSTALPPPPPPPPPQQQQPASPAPQCNIAIRRGNSHNYTDPPFGLYPLPPPPPARNSLAGLLSNAEVEEEWQTLAREIDQYRSSSTGTSSSPSSPQHRNPYGAVGDGRPGAKRKKVRTQMQVQKVHSKVKPRDSGYFSDSDDSDTAGCGGYRIE